MKNDKVYNEVLKIQVAVSGCADLGNEMTEEERVLLVEISDLTKKLAYSLLNK